MLHGYGARDSISCEKLKMKRKSFSEVKRDEENGDISPSNDDDVVAPKNDYDIEASDEELDDQPPKWYDEFPYVKLPKLECADDQVDSLKHEAEVVLSDETTNFKAYLDRSRKSETKWMMTMAKSGTSTDKVSALALMVQESPVHNVFALTSLVNMAKVAKKHQFMAVIDTLTELFINDLLRPTKNLRKFEKQPLAHLSELCGDDNALRRKKLCYWLFEDKLKALFEQFISLLNVAAQDSVQSNREKAIGAMLKFVLTNREQEDTLICNLINKFGDPVHKVASRVVYGLEKVAQRHPKMKEALLDEVEKMLFRPHISKRAQYYGICFLSQYRFGSNDRELCRRLIMLYFSFFKACVKTGDIDSRLMGALLVGVNRAYPYAARGMKSESVIPVEHIDTMYKVVHYAPFKISLQALTLLLQVMSNDRFYNALYRKLFDKELCLTSHQAIWLNLVMRAIRKDDNDNRKKAFVKRILQVCLYFPVPLLCGTLIMLSQIVKQLPDSIESFTFPDEEIEEDKPNIPSIVSNLSHFDDDNEEHVFDVKTEDDTEETNETEDNVKPVSSSWFHRDLLKPCVDTIPTEKKFAPRTAFDSLARNPAYAGGEKAFFNELYTLCKHFHPTVALFSKKILAGERIHYTGDPLKDFTTLHFLDRFSFRNPKKTKIDRGEEKQELFRAVGSERSHYNPKGMRALPVQSDLYLKQKESAVPIDELFLYKYLKGKRSEMESKNEKKRENDDESDLSDVESVGSVEFNDYLDDLMTGQKTAKMLDFAEDIENAKSVKKHKKGQADVEDKDEDEDEEEDLEDDLAEADDDDDDDGENDEFSDEMSKDSEQSDEDDEGAEINEMDLSESEEDEESSKMPLQSALRKRINRDFKNMIMPVEKFSEMLEEAGRSKSGSSHTVLHKDNASEKQLRWEASKVKQRWRDKSNPNKRGHDQGRNSMPFKRKNNFKGNRRFNNKKRKRE